MHHESLIDVKNAVLVGEDRQSYATYSKVIQDALKIIKTYHIAFVPEPYIIHHKNCKTCTGSVLQ